MHIISLYIIARKTEYGTCLGCVNHVVTCTIVLFKVTKIVNLKTILAFSLARSHLHSWLFKLPLNLGKLVFRNTTSCFAKQEHNHNFHALPSQDTKSHNTITKINSITPVRQPYTPTHPILTISNTATMPSSNPTSKSQVYTSVVWPMTQKARNHGYSSIRVYNVLNAIKQRLYIHSNDHLNHQEKAWLAEMLAWEKLCK